MNVRIVFFASIREKLDCADMELSIPQPCKLHQLLDHLLEGRDPTWRETLTAENVRVALNQELINGDPEISPGDEVAFFPPVTGG